MFWLSQSVEAPHGCQLLVVVLMHVCDQLVRHDEQLLANETFVVNLCSDHVILQQLYSTLHQLIKCHTVSVWGVGIEECSGKILLQEGSGDFLRCGPVLHVKSGAMKHGNHQQHRKMLNQWALFQVQFRKWITWKISLHWQHKSTVITSVIR